MKSFPIVICPSLEAFLPDLERMGKDRRTDRLKSDAGGQKETLSKSEKVWFWHAETTAVADDKLGRGRYIILKVANKAIKGEWFIYFLLLGIP